MTSVEFRTLLKEVFEEHCLMKGREEHSVNELLYALRYEEKLQGLQGVNISIIKTDGRCMCIPCLSAYVPVRDLAIWFYDNAVEFETDEFEDDGETKRFDNITVYEREA